MKYMNFISKLLCLVMVLGVLGYYQSIAAVRAEQVAANEAAIEAVEAHNAEIQRQQNELAEVYVAGTYEGSGMGFGGEITVSVTVSATEITAIEVTNHDGEDPAYYDLAVSVTDEVLKKQKTDVDTVSGATFSSAGLLEAISDAVGKAVK